MQTLNPICPSRFEPTVCRQTESENGRSFRADPRITITETALKKIVELKERLEVPVKGLRVKAIPRSPLRADYSMRFVPKEEPESPTDSVISFDGINLYIALDSKPYLDGATIDFVFRLIGSEFKVEAPLRNLHTPDGRIAAKIQQVLDEEINQSQARLKEMLSGESYDRSGSELRDTGPYVDLGPWKCRLFQLGAL